MAGTYGRAPIWAGNLPEAFNYVGSPPKKIGICIGNPYSKRALNGHLNWTIIKPCVIPDGSSWIWMTSQGCHHRQKGYHSGNHPQWSPIGWKCQVSEVLQSSHRPSKSQVSIQVLKRDWHYVIMWYQGCWYAPAKRAGLQRFDCVLRKVAHDTVLHRALYENVGLNYPYSFVMFNVPVK